ncbi:unnamed protein product [Closterium sp. NIES-53]
MWIFRVKRPLGSPPAFKAHYVARGFSQRQGVDYFQTFSPTPKMTTLQVLLHVAAQCDYELHSLDFSTDFLQGNLHEEIWLRRPPGFNGSFPAGTLWSLRRPDYGLHQALRAWLDTLRTIIKALGFTPSTADLSLFLSTDTSLPPFYVLVYVNDLVFATAYTEAMTLVKSELQKRHTCTDLGELRSYLGLQITRDRARRTITLTQSHMVHQVLQRFSFQFSSPQPTPLSTSQSLSAPPSDEFIEPTGPYPELVGCLMHRKLHWDAAKRVLRYLCGTSGMGLMLGGRGLLVLTSHADASWVDDLATQRSSQGYIFSLGAMAAQELRWLTYLLTNLGEQPRSPPVLYVDNKAMIAFCQEHRLEHRTKHIALRYFLARELQQRAQLRLAYVATRANTADIFTKALPPGDHAFILVRFCDSSLLHCSPVFGGSVRLTVRSSTPLVLYELGEYRCPPGCNGHHHHSSGRRPGSSLYTLATEPPQVAASTQVFASGPVEPPCSCRLLLHQTLPWHHRLDQPSLPRLHGMHSRLLVSGLSRSLPPLPPSPTPPCLPCIEGRQRAAPHSSFPPTAVPLQTLHMDVWGPSPRQWTGVRALFLLVVDDYTRYTMVFPLRSKGEVPDVLIPWIRAVRLQLRERFRLDLLVLRLHSDRGGEFSSDLLRDFCRGEGILQKFMLPASPQQNGIAERRIGLVMEVARTSMIHAAAPHFLWPFAVRYAAHQLNLWPRVSLPKTSPKLRWTGKVGDASVFRVLGSHAFFRDTSADKLSARAIPCVFLGFVPNAPGWQFYHPTSHRLFPS